MTLQVTLTLLLLCVAVASLSVGSMLVRGWQREPASEFVASASWARCCAIMLGVLALLVALNASHLALRRHQLFMSFGYDLATMDQTVWNTAHGRWLQCSEGGEEVTRPRRGRVELVYFPVALLYRWWPGPETLLVVQAFALVAAVFPLYALARRRSGHPPFALAVSLAYLLHPGLLGISQHSFHANALAVPFAMCMLVCVALERFPAALAGAVLTMACREDLGLLVFPLGLYVAWIQGQRRWGGGMIALGLLWMLGALFVLPAWFGEPASVVSARPAQAMLGRLAHGVSGLLKFYRDHPGEMLPSLLNAHNAFYLATLVGPFAFLPLLAPRLLLIAGPTLLFYLLSGWIEMTQVDKHYTANLLPPLAVAMVAGAEGVRRLGNTRLWWALALHLVLLSALFACLPETRLRWRQGSYWSARHRAALAAAVRTVPAEAAVIASQHLAPHLSQRRRLALWETDAFDHAEFAIFDGLGSLMWRTWIAPANPTRPHVIVPYPVELLRDPRWRVEWARDCVMVLRREREPASAGARTHSLHTLFEPGATEMSPALRFAAGDLVGFAVSTRHATFGRLYRLQLDWQQLRVGTARPVLLFRDGERILAVAHTPAHGLLDATTRAFGETVIVHLPLPATRAHWQFGIGETTREVRSDTEVPADAITNTHWLPVPIREGAT